ncbi:MAG: hypothetical protein ACRD1F_03595, partial [Terriglobales bacterium]
MTVIKVGGSILEPAPTNALITALLHHAQAGPLAIVHGGGKTLTALLAKLAIAAEFRKGLRVTSAETLGAAVMALAGTVNTALTAALNAAGIRAVGLTGCDAACVRAQPIPELGAVGAITAADPRLLRSLLDAGFTPVLASLALQQGSAATGPLGRVRSGPGGADQREASGAEPPAKTGCACLNVNADQFAAAIAAALGAQKLLFLTDVDGVLDAAGHTLPQASLTDLSVLAAAGALHGGMLPKTAACT